MNKSRHRRNVALFLCGIAGLGLIGYFICSKNLRSGGGTSGGLNQSGSKIVVHNGGADSTKSKVIPDSPERKHDEIYVSAKNGFDIAGGGVSFPDEMTYGTGLAGTTGMIAAQHLSEVLSRQGWASKGSIEQTDAFPEYLNRTDDVSLPFGPVFLSKGNSESAAQFEKKLHDELKALTGVKDFEKFWDRFKAAAAHDPNLRGFGEYDLYVRFREEDPSNKIVALRFALCEPGTMKVVSSREMQSAGFGPYLGALFSFSESSNE